MQPQQLQEWRRSARQVTRAWNEWLAAESRERGVRYRAFVIALGDEERAAAEVERVVELRNAREGTATGDQRTIRRGPQ